MSLLDGKVALVSGVGPGLGRSIAVVLAEHGADVALAARRQEHLVAASGDVEATGRRVVWLPTDICRIEDCERLVNHVRLELGRLDVLVNVAHTAGSDHPFLETYGREGAAGDAWRRSFEVNFFGSLNMTRAAVEPMLERGEGRVVMINTMAVRDVQPGQGPYASSKAALAMAARSLARELGPLGIRVNSVHPGWIRGHATDRYFERVARARDISPEEASREMAGATALRYLPDEREIAGTVVWLASDLARPVTGQSIDVNAGHWM